MVSALVVLIIFTAIISLFLFTKNNKLFFISSITLAVVATIVFCFTKPTLHKQFSIDIIDYIVKFNTDGSMTTTKQTTITTIKEGKN